MSWHFSQALVAEFSEDTCSVGELFALSSMNPTPLLFCAPDRMTAFSRLSRFGMTCGPLTADRGEELLTWYRADFLARTSVSPEPERESTVSDRDSGERWRGSWARFDPDTSSWRTAQCSLLEDSDEFSGTWPRSGLMRRGECYPLPISGRRTSEKESGSWPTPVRSDAIGGPRTPDAKRGPRPGLNYAVRIPTPTVGDAKSSGSRNTANSNANPGISLTDFVRQDGGAGRMFPTATATAYKGWSTNHNRADTDDRIDYTIEREAHQSGQAGRLNPTWVEWLMGWPLGWTDLRPLETGRFAEWQQQHSPSCQPGSVGEEAA